MFHPNLIENPHNVTVMRRPDAGPMSGSNSAGRMAPGVDQLSDSYDRMGLNGTD